MPLGGLRLIDTTGSRIDKAVTVVDQQLARVPWLAKGRGRTFYAVGGTWRSLARLHMEQSNYPLRVMHGYALPTAEAIAFCAMVRKTKKLTLLPGIQEVSRARREVLPYGALVLERLLEQIGPEQVVFSVFGIREGLLFGLLPPDERQRSRCSRSARITRGCARARSSTRTSSSPGPTRCSKAGPERNSRRATPAARRLPHLRHRLARASRLPRRAEPQRARARRARRHRSPGARLPGAVRLLSPHRARRGEEELSERLMAVVSKRVQKRARIIGARSGPRT